MSRPSIADDLREYANVLYERGIITEIDNDALVGIADKIDSEHERRVEQCRIETKRAMCRYMGSVLLDYKRGIKREARKKATRIDWGDHVACSCGRVLEREDKFCPKCGAKLKIQVSEKAVLDG